jgi:hypothetical protein
VVKTRLEGELEETSKIIMGSLVAPLSNGGIKVNIVGIKV